MTNSPRSRLRKAKRLIAIVTKNIVVGIVASVHQHYPLVLRNSSNQNRSQVKTMIDPPRSLNNRPDFSQKIHRSSVRVNGVPYGRLIAYTFGSLEFLSTLT